MKKSWGALLLFGLLTAGVSSAAEPWSPEMGGQSGYTTFSVSDAFGVHSGASTIRRLDYVQKTGWVHIVDCPAVSGYCSPKIARNGQSVPSSKVRSVLEADLVMGVCKSKTQDFCIEDVRIYETGTKPTHAKLISEVETLPTASFNERGLPAGGSASNWEPAVDSPALNGLKVTVSARALFKNSEDGFQMSAFDLIISPYSEIEYPAGTVSGLVRGPSKSGWKSSFSSACVWTNLGVCAKLVDHPKGVIFGVTFRVEREQVSFFSGRLTDPLISVRQMSGNRRRVSVDGGAVAVNGFSMTAPTTSKLAGDLRDGSYLPEELLSHVSYRSGADISVQNTRWFDIAAARGADTAPGERTWWRLSTVTAPNRCWDSNGTLSGIVTSNATAYSFGAPTFGGGYLTYQVAGLHFNPDGTEALGTYDLVLRSDVARCLYGFSKAPVYGSVSITGEGDSRVATTVVKEKDGWVYVSAKGFTFSKKTIKVKLTQKRR